MKMLLSLLLTQCAVVHGQTCTPSSSSIINDFSSFAGAGHTSLLFVTIEGECDADMYAFYTTKLAPYAAALGNNMTTTYHKLSATNPLPSGAGASCADNNAAASTATSGLYPTCNAIPTASCTDTTYGAAIRAACPVRCSVCPSLDDYTQIWIADFSSTDAAYAASEWALVKTWFNAQTGREVITDGRFAADALRGGVTELRGPNLGSTTASTGSLEACDGECDDTSDCLLGLSCFERENGEPIPGCSGTGTGKDWDYCYAPAMAIYPEIAEGKVCFPDSPWLGDAPSVGSAASQPEGYPSGAVASKIPQLWKNYVDVLRAKEHGGLVLLTGAGIFFNPDQKTPRSAGTGGYGINQVRTQCSPLKMLSLLFIFPLLEHLTHPPPIPLFSRSLTHTALSLILSLSLQHRPLPSPPFSLTPIISSPSNSGTPPSLRRLRAHHRGQSQARVVSVLGRMGTPPSPRLSSVVPGTRTLESRSLPSSTATTTLFGCRSQDEERS